MISFGVGVLVDVEFMRDWIQSRRISVGGGCGGGGGMDGTLEALGYANTAKMLKLISSQIH